MYADVEELVLSGKLFNGESPSSSPIRSRSQSPCWPELDSDFESPNVDDGASEDDLIDELEDTSGHPKVKKNGRSGVVRESIGMKPGRTGVKGVIQDRNEMVELENERRAKRVLEMNDRMEKMNLGGMTYLEEKAFDEKQKWRREAAEDWEERKMIKQELRSGKFGHLREVGVGNFVSALEDEDPSVWVVVHLFDQSLERCITLDNTLSLLARSYPAVKFIRTRAGALGFAAQPTRSKPPPRILEDEDDIEDEDQEEEHDVDTDMLPTVLVYRAGQLVHNWVRVDWVIRDEVGSLDLDIQSLLEKHGILGRNAKKRASVSDDSLDIEFEHDLDY